MRALLLLGLCACTEAVAPLGGLTPPDGGTVRLQDAGPGPLPTDEYEGVGQLEVEGQPFAMVAVPAPTTLLAVAFEAPPSIALFGLNPGGQLEEIDRQSLGNDELPKALIAFEYEQGVAMVAMVVQRQDTLVLKYWPVARLEFPAAADVIVDCLNDLCGQQGCFPRAQFQARVHLAARPSYNGSIDLTIGTAATLDVVTFISSDFGPFDFPYVDGRCTCARFGQAPVAFEFAEFGGPIFLPDIVMAGPAGPYVRYTEPLDDGSQLLTCGQSCPLGNLKPVHQLGVGYFTCDPRLEAECRQDVIILQSEGASPFFEAGNVSLLAPSARDDCSDALISYDLAPPQLAVRGPVKLRIADLDGDQREDVAVLYADPPVVQIWQGSMLGQQSVIPEAAPADTCQRALDFVPVDLDADAVPEIAVLCETPSGAHIYTHRRVR